MKPLVSAQPRARLDSISRREEELVHRRCRRSCRTPTHRRTCPPPREQASARRSCLGGGGCWGYQPAAGPLHAGLHLDSEHQLGIAGLPAQRVTKLPGSSCEWRERLPFHAWLLALHHWWEQLREVPAKGSPEAGCPRPANLLKPTWSLRPLSKEAHRAASMTRPSTVPR
jgi:hypothetical protein